MSEKKAKQLREEGRQVVAEISIKALANGNVEVFGPINNLLMFTDIMNKAERTVLNHTARSAQNKSNIIVPDLKILTN